MKNKHSLGVHFYLRKDRAQNNKSALYVRITVDGHRSVIALKHKVAQAHWNEAMGMAKAKTDELRMLNTQLEQIRSSIVSCFHDLQQECKPINAEAIKARYLGTDEKRRETLCRLIEYHNEKHKAVLSPGTMKNYYSTERYLKKFLKEHYRKQDLFLAELDYKFITEFEFFLMKHPLKDHDPLANNGLMKHMERLKKMSRLAVSLDWIEKDPFEKYKLHFDKTERGYLSAEELYHLQHGELHDQQLKYARDLFIFSCYTGMAFCDVATLRRDSIVTGIDGKRWIYTHRQKTNIAVKVPILEDAERIIQQYNNDPRAENASLVFRPITNQEINRNLKILAGIFKIKKHLTFHLARHTFATTIALANGVPMETVSKLLGHSKITTTQIYAKVGEQKISTEMNNLAEKLKQRKAFNRATA